MQGLTHSAKEISILTQILLTHSDANIVDLTGPRITQETNQTSVPVKEYLV